MDFAEPYLTGFIIAENDMFGFLKPLCRSQKYRQLYCDTCAHMRLNYGLLSTLFLSYESVLVHAMALDYGLIREQDTVLPCRVFPFPKKLNESSDIHHRIGEFSSALTLLLVKTKLDDDILDDRSWRAMIVNWLFRKRFDQSVKYFKELDPNFETTLGMFFREHREMELGRSATSLDEYARPTAAAFGYVFGLLGAALNEPARSELFASIGTRIGKAIIFADCAYDWKRDMKKGLYNPVQSLDDSAHAIAASQGSLREGTSIAKQAFGNNSVTEHILIGVHDRLYRATRQDEHYQPYLVPLQECASLSNVEKKQSGIIMASNAACPALVMFAQADQPDITPCVGCILAACGCIIVGRIIGACRNNCGCCDETCKCCGDCSAGCSEADKQRPVGNGDTVVQDTCFNCCDGCLNASDKRNARRAREHWEKTGKDIDGGCR